MENLPPSSQKTDNELAYTALKTNFEEENLHNYTFKFQITAAHTSHSTVVIRIN